MANQLQRPLSNLTAELVDELVKISPKTKIEPVMTVNKINFGPPDGVAPDTQSQGTQDSLD